MTDAAHWHGPGRSSQYTNDLAKKVNQKKTRVGFKTKKQCYDSQKKEANYYVTNLLQMEHL